MSDMSILLIECHARRASDGAAQTLRLASGGVRADYFGVQWLPALIELPVMGARLGFDGRSFTAPVTSTVGGFSFSRNFKGLEGAQDLIWKGADITIWQGTSDDLSVIWQGRAQGSSARDAAIVVDLADPAEEMAKPLVDQRFAGTGGLEGGEDVEGRIKPRAWGLCENIPAILIDAPNNIWLLVDGPSTVHDVRDGGVAYIGPRVDVADYAALMAEEVPSGGVGVCEALSLVKPWRVPRFTLTANVTVGTVGTAAEIAQAMLGERTSLSFAPGAVAGYVQQPSVSSYVADERTLAQEFDRLFGGLGSFWRFNSQGEIELGLIDFAAPTLTFDKGVVSVTRSRTIMPTYRRVLTYRPNYRPMSDGELAQGVDEADLGPGAFASSLYELDAAQAAKLDGIEAGATAGAEFGVNIGGLGGSPQGIDLIGGAEWSPRFISSYSYLGALNQGLSLASLGLQVGDYVSYSAHVDDVGTANPNPQYLFRPRGAGFALLQSKSKTTTTPGWLSDTLLIPENCEYLELRSNVISGAFTASKVQLVKGAYPLMGQQGAAPGATVGATPLEIAQINQALSDAENARAIADGKIVTFAQATQPSGQADGDLWIDTDDGNKLYRWNGGAWVMLQDTAIGDAIAMASDAFARADSKIVTFSSETPPTAEGEGDLWQKPSTRQLYRWNGSAWDAITAAGVQDGAQVNPTPSMALNKGWETDDLTKWYVNHINTVPLGAPYSIVDVNVDGVGAKAIRGEDNGDGTNDFFSEPFPIDPTKHYKVSVYARQPFGDRRHYLLVNFLRPDLTSISGGIDSNATGWRGKGTFHYWRVSNEIFSTNFTKYEFVFGPNGEGQIPNAPGHTAAYAQIGLLGMRTGTTNTRIELQGYRLEEIADALTLVNGPAEAGAQVNGASTLVLLINSTINGTAYNGRVSLVGVQGGLPAVGTDGFINWYGSKIQVDANQRDFFTCFTSQVADQAFLAFDTTKSNPFLLGSVPVDVALVRKNGSQWQYDNNTSWVNFTPTADMAALGWLKTDVPDHIQSGGLFGQPVPLELAAFPSADVTGDNTAMAVMGQGAGATANSLMEMNPGEGTKLAGIQAGATVGARAGVNLLDGQGVQLFDWDVRNNIDQSIRTPGGGVLTGTTSVQTGSLKIRLPQSWTNTMMKFTVDIFEYTAGYSCTLEIAGYNYSGGSARWINVTARVIGGSNVEYPVYFGHDGTKCCVWIGGASETWSYPQVRVRDVLLGYSNTTRALWDTGWQISFDAGGAQNVTAQVDDTYPAADWRKVTGPGRPEDGATMGADWGTNVANIPYDQVISNADDVALGFNPTFSKWTGVYPDGWANWTSPAPTKETSLVRAGKYAVRYSAGGTNLGMQRQYDFGSQPLPAGTFIGGSLDLRLESRTSGLPGILVRLFTNDALTTFIDNRVQPPSTATGVWQRIPWTARANGQAIYAIQIYVMASWGSFATGSFTGTVIFDNIRFALFDSSTDNTTIQLTSDGKLMNGGTMQGNVSLGGLGAGALATRNDVDWLSHVSGKPITYRVVATGLSSTSSPAASGMYNESGTLVQSAGRSYRVDVFDRATRSLVSSTNYDVYGSVTNATNMANALNALGSNRIVVIRTHDEPKNNRLSGGLPAAIKRCGGSRAIFESSNFKARSAYVLVGIPGIGEGNGLELYSGDVDNDPDAWVDTTFTIDPRGNVQLGRTMVRNAVDISFADGTLVEDLKPAQAGATAGADWNSNVSGRPSDDTIYNNRLSLTNDGKLMNGGTMQGSVSITGLGGGALATMNTIDYDSYVVGNKPLSERATSLTLANDDDNIWIRVATISGTAGRGSYVLTLFGTGGGLSPSTATFDVTFDWGTTANVTLISKSRNMGWLQRIRASYDSSAQISYLDIKVGSISSSTLFARVAQRWGNSVALPMTKNVSATPVGTLHFDCDITSAQCGSISDVGENLVYLTGETWLNGNRALRTDGLAENVANVGTMPAATVVQRATQVSLAFNAATNLNDTILQLQQGGGVARRLTQSLAVGSGIHGDSFDFSPARSEIPVIRPFSGGKAVPMPGGQLASTYYERRIRALNATTAGFTLEAVFAAPQSTNTTQNDTGRVVDGNGFRIEKGPSTEAVDDIYTAHFSVVVYEAEYDFEDPFCEPFCGSNPSSLTVALDTRPTSSTAWTERSSKTFYNFEPFQDSFTSTLQTTVNGLGSAAAWRIRVKSAGGYGGYISDLTKVSYIIPSGTTEITESVTPAGSSPIVFEVLGGEEQSIQ